MLSLAICTGISHDMILVTNQNTKLESNICIFDYFHSEVWESELLYFVPYTVLCKVLNLEYMLRCCWTSASSMMY